MNVEKNYQGKGGYVFVSHSHLDIERVREIRNYLENAGMEPILFYLRCMDGGDEEKLASLKKLIFDEIDSREFFLYVDSKNAAASEWVQEELAHIRATRPDRITEITATDDKEQTEKTLSRMLRGMRVFISASARDRELTRRFTEALTKHDFRVYDTNAVVTGESWQQAITHTIADLAEEGFVITLITRASLASLYVRDELAFALEKRVPVLPIVVGDAFAQGTPVGFSSFRDVRWCSLPEEPTDEEIERAVRDVIAMRDRFFGK